MSIMNTFTGHQFDPLQMTISDVSLEDIAHALSFLCRGGGLLFCSPALTELCQRSTGSRMVLPDDPCLPSPRCK